MTNHATPAPDAQPPVPMCWRGESQSGCYSPDCCSEDGAGRDECGHEWLDRPESDTRECLICGEVGTGAGEGATGQDTGTAWVTRSTDCPEAPAQAHLPASDACHHGVSYDVECAGCDADGAEARAAGALTPNEIGIYFKGKTVAEGEVESLRQQHAEAEWLLRMSENARDRAERRAEAADAVLAKWDWDPETHHVGALHAEILADLRVALTVGEVS